MYEIADRRFQQYHSEYRSEYPPRDRHTRQAHTSVKTSVRLTEYGTKESG
jgi:hypothetical protein